MSNLPWSTRLHAPAQIEEVVAALKKRGIDVANDHCMRCKRDQFNVDILGISVDSAMSRPGLPFLQGNYVWTAQPNSSIRVLAIVCTNCGYTIFHNLNALGLE